MPTRILKIAKTTVSIVVITLMLLEGALRVYYRKDFGVPTHRSWTLQKVWYDKYERANSLGFRDDEFQVEKSPNTFRILIIGDSHTYGQGVEEIENLYPSILERRLDRLSDEEIRYEVLNIAKQGWNVEQYLRALKEYAPTYQPDLTIFGICLNDIELDRASRPQALEILPTVPHELLSRLSYAYWYTYSALNALYTGERYQEYILSFTDESSDDWTRFSAIWGEIGIFAREEELSLAAAILPRLSNLEEGHAFENVYDRIVHLLQLNGVSSRSLYGSVDGKEARQFWVGATDPHANEAAHALYAEAILAFLIREGLVREHTDPEAQHRAVLP